MAANPLTTQYGALKGWQWAAGIGVLGATYLYLRSRSSSAAPAPNMAGQALDAAGNPIPGSEILAPIIIQQGNPSAPITKPAPVVKPPVRPPVVAPPKVNANNYPRTIAGTSAAARTMIKIGTVNGKGNYVGRNVAGGAPVYQRSSASGSFYQGPFSAGHDVYVPSDFAQYIVGK